MDHLVCYKKHVSSEMFVYLQVEAYKEAFADFDWNKSGTIPTSVCIIKNGH